MCVVSNDLIKYKCCSCNKIAFAENINEIIDSEKKCGVCSSEEVVDPLKFYTDKCNEMIKQLSHAGSLSSVEFMKSVVLSANKLILSLESIIVHNDKYFMLAIRNMNVKIAEVKDRIKNKEKA